jgi:glycosyltransferase involved in cell wall biosynthesis
MKNKLILFTSDFPFGTGETFLETEIEYLCKGFDEVQIVSSSGRVQTRSVPENCAIERIDLHVGASQKLLSLLQVFNPLFWKELKVIRTVYQLPISMGIIFTMLVSLKRGKKVAQKVRALSEKIGSNEQLFFYSYWCDDVALGIAIAQKKHREIKTFCRIHRWDVYFDQSAVNYLPYRHYITSQLKAIFSISQDGIEYAKNVWKTSLDSKFHLSRLGINNERPLKKVERDYLLLVSCSNLIPIKRVHFIAEALQFIADRRIHWVHIGDGPERQRLEGEVVRLPQNISVEFKGRIPNSSIYDYYDELRPDLFINVSSSEGVPVSIMEAMSFGIPVIATNVGGNSEIVNSNNGYQLNADFITEQLTKVIESFLEHPPLLKENKQRASFETWKLKYNAEDNYRQFVTTIQDL